MATVTEADMAPGASPSQQSRSAGVRRVNNLPLILIGAVLAIFLVIMGMVAFDRSVQQQSTQAPTEQQQAGTSIMLAKAIAGDLNDGIVPPAPPSRPTTQVPGASPSEPVDIVVARPLDPDQPPAPPRSMEYPADARIPAHTDPARPQAVDSIRQAKLQSFGEAVQARTAVSLQQAQAVPHGAALPMTPPSGTGPQATANTAAVEAHARGERHNLQQFAAAHGGDRWVLEAQPEAPRSPYSLRAGFVIPALLVSAINSELPGQIIGQVSQDVRDSARGQWLLIPQGSRLVGQYSSDVAYGQARVMVAWQRIIFPDGKAMDIGAMPGADGAGRAGFGDRVNNHYWKTFTSALLMSTVTAGVGHSQHRARGYEQRDFSTAMSEAVGQQLGQVASQLISKNLNVAPTLEIRPGFRFNVVVTKDLSFTQPYRAFDYQPR